MQQLTINQLNNKDIVAYEQSRFDYIVGQLIPELMFLIDDMEQELQTQDESKDLFPLMLIFMQEQSIQHYIGRMKGLVLSNSSLPIDGELIVNGYSYRASIEYIGDMATRDTSHMLRTTSITDTIKGIVDRVKTMVYSFIRECRTFNTRHVNEEVINLLSDNKGIEWDGEKVPTHLVHKSIIDARTTQICRDRNGKVYTLKYVQEHDEVIPPLHYNCRSLLIPIIVNANTPNEQKN